VDVTDKDGGVGSTQLHVTVDPAESTPVGTNVAVSPVDPTTGTQPVAISFATVSSGGVTTIASANTPPAATSAIQSSFSVASAVYYDIRTTATFSGAATVCVTYPAGTFAPGVQPALLHYNGTAWEDVTTSSNATTLTVCGSVTSFSPFAVVRRNSAPVVGSLANSSTIGQYSVRAAFTDSDGNDDGPWSWAITWGDGSAATTGTAASQSPIDAGHVFADPGNYTVTIVVTDRSGAASVAKTVSVHVFDTTPPVVSSAVSGTQGQNGWYTSDVTVRWTTSARSPITTPACADNVLTTDTPSATFTCTTTSEGGTTTKTVIVARDATNPVVSYAGNAGSYTVDQAVSITCSASDATSGLASNGCADVSGAGYTFALGTTSFSATAVDRAGNSASASGSFTMRATSGSVCALVERWTSKQGVANSLCVKLTHGDVGAFRNEVSAQSGKAIDADKAAILTKLADAL
jgi:hypothetical protein